MSNSVPCFAPQCNRLAYGGHRYCCRYCRQGDAHKPHGRGCDERARRRDRQAPVIPLIDVPPGIPPKWQQQWREGTESLRALIARVAARERAEGQQEQFRCFARRLLRAFHPDVSSSDAGNLECVQFLTQLLQEEAP